MKGCDFKPIGSVRRPFTGVFNGNGFEIRDYSIISYSEYSDDNCSGVRGTLQLLIPSPINLCEYKDNFIEKEEEVTVDIDIDITDENKLILNPIKLS